MASYAKPKSIKSEITTVADGSYKATLSKVNSFTNVYGQRVGFEFTLHGDDVEGVTLLRTTNAEISPKSKLSELLHGLIGHDLTDKEIKEGFYLDKLIGTDCNVLVINSQGKNGKTYSNVDRVYQ